MAGHNRYLRGNRNEITVPIHSDTVCEPGDLMVIGGRAGVDQAGRGADYYGYSFSEVTGSVLIGGVSNAMNYCKQWFLGVAMSGSASGVTNNVTVATDGTFRMPYHKKATADVTGTTLGLIVTAVTSPTVATGAGVSPQHVSLIDGGNAAVGGPTAYLGYCMHTRPGGTTFVDFRIHTKYGLGLIT